MGFLHWPTLSNRHSYHKGKLVFCVSQVNSSNLFRIIFYQRRQRNFRNEKVTNGFTKKRRSREYFIKLNCLKFMTIYQRAEFKLFIYLFIFLPKVKLDFCRGTFLFSGPKLLNKLPENIINAENIQTCRRDILEHFKFLQRMMSHL